MTIQLRQLVEAFGKRVVVDHLDLDVKDLDQRCFSDLQAVEKQQPSA